MKDTPLFHHHCICSGTNSFVSIHMPTDVSPSNPLRKEVEGTARLAEPLSSSLSWGRFLVVVGWKKNTGGWLQETSSPDLIVATFELMDKAVYITYEHLTLLITAPAGKQLKEQQLSAR
ncbi:hypothetical protein EK904_013399 [Melospiza melodia maxima]|nr:hypothetical protein EK904_013399 [Melospiza melodia maxima]